jgi:hypothetical protein
MLLARGAPRGAEFLRTARGSGAALAPPGARARPTAARARGPGRRCVGPSLPPPARIRRWKLALTSPSARLSPSRQRREIGQPSALPNSRPLPRLALALGLQSSMGAEDDARARGGRRTSASRAGRGCSISSRSHRTPEEGLEAARGPRRRRNPRAPCSGRPARRRASARRPALGEAPRRSPPAGRPRARQERRLPRGAGRAASLRRGRRSAAPRRWLEDGGSAGRRRPRPADRQRRHPRRRSSAADRHPAPQRWGARILCSRPARNMRRRRATSQPAASSVARPAPRRCLDQPRVGRDPQHDQSRSTDRFPPGAWASTPLAAARPRP